ncbi:uncharacterized protein LOC132825663 [Hemiscyllium ocellatum]|uniref:uncharacterized protein LOC132825663 n=1 Tax=Hemiscyllium ocellatum TaxID=170820 RepID=UPI0029673D7E|nr:uncharacterized protein LOC132825663 [Hemiscyllium ocellatum]
MCWDSCDAAAVSTSEQDILVHVIPAPEMCNNIIEQVAKKVVKGCNFSQHLLNSTNTEGDEAIVLQCKQLERPLPLTITGEGNHSNSPCPSYFDLAGGWLLNANWLFRRHYCPLWSRKTRPLPNQSLGQCGAGKALRVRQHPRSRKIDISGESPSSLPNQTQPRVLHEARRLCDEGSSEMPYFTLEPEGPRHLAWDPTTLLSAPSPPANHGTFAGELWNYHNYEPHPGTGEEFQKKQIEITNCC